MSQWFSQTGIWGRQRSLPLLQHKQRQQQGSLHPCRDGRTYRRNTPFKSSPPLKLPCVSQQVRGSTRVTTSEQTGHPRWLPSEQPRQPSLGKGRSAVGTWETWRRVEGFVGEAFSEERNCCGFLKEKLTLSAICKVSISRWSGTPLWEGTAISNDKWGCLQLCKVTAPPCSCIQVGAALQCQPVWGVSQSYQHSPIKKTHLFLLTLNLCFPASLHSCERLFSQNKSLEMSLGQQLHLKSWAACISLKHLSIQIYRIDMLLSASLSYMNSSPCLYLTMRFAPKSSMLYFVFLDHGTEMCSTLFHRAAPRAYRSFWACVCCWDSCGESSCWWLEEMGLAGLWRSVWTCRIDLATVVPCSAWTVPGRDMVFLPGTP